MKKRIAELTVGDVFKLSKNAKVKYILAYHHHNSSYSAVIKLLKGGNIIEQNQKNREVYFIGHIGPDGKFTEASK